MLSCLLEPLRMVRELYQEDIIWKVVTIDDETVHTSSGLAFSPTHKIEEVDGNDILVVLSSNEYRQQTTTDHLRAVMSLCRQSEIIIGADAGPWLLAATGMLNDKRATLHWSILSEFAETFPHVNVSQDSMVRDGRYWTCGSASTALRLMLLFISERFGDAKAFMTSAMFLHDSSRQSPGTPGSTNIDGTASGKLNDILKIMVDAIEHPLSLQELAEAAYMSPRTLNRLFKSELGMAPGQYYQALRLARARELAETSGFGLHEIALRCGYCDAAALSKAYKKAFGHPIRRGRSTVLT